MTHLEILKYLDNTFSANFYLVGGFVRDMLSGIHTDDYDIATDLEPEQILKIAHEKNIKAIPTGLKHGTVTLFVDGKELEVTTFRQDFENNGRHCSVKYTKSIKEDSIRRDFTINALYLDANGQLYDFHSGQDDLKKGRVRFIGDPSERINEDYLRMLRFFRFYALFDKNGISIRDEDFKQTLNDNATKLKELSADRISQEFLKQCKSLNYTRGFATMATIGQLERSFGLNPQTLNSKDSAITENCSEFFKLCLLYRNNLSEVLVNKKFNWSNKQKSFVKKLIKVSDFIIDEAEIIKLAVIYTKDVLEFKLIAQYLDGDLIKVELLEFLEMLEQDLPEFQISGADLISLGFVADKRLGQALKCIRQYWLDNNFADKDKCLNFARKILENSLYLQGK